MRTFLSLIEGEGGVGLQTDDVLLAVLPLLKQVAALHAQGLVMEWNGIGSISLNDDDQLSTATSGIETRSNIAAVNDLGKKISNALRVKSYKQFTSDDETGTTYTDLDVIESGQQFSNPAFVAGYTTWEQELGHQDALTDILLLGQILASLSLGLDFSDISNLRTFCDNRKNLFSLRDRLQPVVAAVIVEMTELDRHRRSSDLSSIIFRLENYRDQTVELDLKKIPGFEEETLKGRRRLLQERLRERLFEISRRNRLLYFKQSQSTLNLTVASVPLVLKIASIKLTDLFLWHKPLNEELIAGGQISLRRWLRFEDQPYLPSALDKLISDARRDRAEYGFAQLRLVVAFLHWHNLKESASERINSPLLLLPIELTKKKGVKDQYVLQTTSGVAEVNPALRHHLNQLYGLRLPETVDLTTTSLEDFHNLLKTQIHASEPGVVLRLLDKPEIEIIHEKARQKLAKFQKKQTVRKATPRQKSSFGFSYDKDNLNPLGLQLFLEKVKPRALPQRAASGGAVYDRIPYMVSKAERESHTETERQTYALTSDSGGNPYTWDFDVCSLTIGNFNYRKMSLVRDYSQLLEGDISSESFDRVFSIDPKLLSDDGEKAQPMSGADDWTVAPSDAKQAAAVSFARTGRSCIIQGPPGTGKSQTITNLIADFVAQGKTVLFVCEKRAAIDVVFHRLKQRGLDELCCLIHDSQADKKAFIQNLKQTYETWIARSDGLESVSKVRANKLASVAGDMESLTRFDAAMRYTPDGSSDSVRRLLERLIQGRKIIPSLKPVEVEQLPKLSDWDDNSHLALRISTILSEISHTSILAAHPYRWLGAGVIRADRPIAKLGELSEQIEAAIEELSGKLQSTGLVVEYWSTTAKLRALSELCEILGDLASRDQLALLDERSDLTKELNKAAAEIEKLQKDLEQCLKKTTHWQNKLAPSDTEAALAQVKAQEASSAKWFKPSWWKLRTVLKSSYDIKKHAVHPGYLQILSELNDEHIAQRNLDQSVAEAERKFVCTPWVLKENLKQLEKTAFKTTDLLSLRTILQASGGAEIVNAIRALKTKIEQFAAHVAEMFDDADVQELETLGEIIRDLSEESDALPELLPSLSELLDTPQKFNRALRTMVLSPEQLEVATVHAALEDFYRTERWLPKFDGRFIDHRASRASFVSKELLKDNAAVIRATAHHNFRDRVQISSSSATQLSAEHKKLKKSYSAGRRELEHEFGKSMRYKSIRDLVAGESGAVVRDLKPVWLMSPLSVSDTLPLVPNLFDVIIFDEASQITVEEAVPALYRAPQVIVVGDEMQLPPTKFFAAQRDSDTSDLLEAQEDGERIMISLDSDSLLAQSARNLPSSLLAWHYRSRSESLISYSNAAFYAGNLFTIPDRVRQAEELSEILVVSAADAGKFTDAVLDRPISFHLMERSPYLMRRNTGEAEYIAELVAELLRRDTKLSIGIVAFSEAQQTEIERALDYLAEQNTEFGRRLEEECAREDDDQFCGLFVKNLENVQGDERDIIILSICYGPDDGGKMLMNFGPVNQKGGEKRLNVIFSRAKQHMAIVSSIRHTAITNDYNDGAAALKKFLQYAQASSMGQSNLSRSILEGLNPLSRSNLAQFEKDVVIEELGAALREMGFVVDTHIGQSKFRCDLGVTHASAGEYIVGIIVDSSSHYENTNVFERFITQPDILKDFGWRVAMVLTKDWYHERQLVLDRIVRMMSGEDLSPPVEDFSPPEESEASLPSIHVVTAHAHSVAPAPAAHDISAAAAIGAAPPPPEAFRRFEFVEGNSSKFWEIAREGRAITIRFGRIGTTGQTKTTLFDSVERAEKEEDKLVNEKVRKGYVSKSE